MKIFIQILVYPFWIIWMIGLVIIGLLIIIPFQWMIDGKLSDDRVNDNEKRFAKLIKWFNKSDFEDLAN